MKHIDLDIIAGEDDNFIDIRKHNLLVDVLEQNGPAGCHLVRITGELENIMLYIKEYANDEEEIKFIASHIN